MEKVGTRVAECDNKHDQQQLLGATCHSWVVPKGSLENLEDNSVAGYDPHEFSLPVENSVEIRKQPIA